MFHIFIEITEEMYFCNFKSGNAFSKILSSEALFVLSRKYGQVQIQVDLDIGKRSFYFPPAGSRHIFTCTVGQTAISKVLPFERT